MAERASHTVYPPEDQVWTWTHMCPISQVKVVILGQDPYHNPQQAQGTVPFRSVQVSLPLHRAHIMITDGSLFIYSLKLNFYVTFYSKIESTL